MKNRSLFSIFTLVFLVGQVLSGQSLSVKISNTRHAYYRNEEVTFQTLISNNGSAQINNVNVSITLSPLETVQKTLNLKSGENTAVKYYLKCSRLKPGDYFFKVTTFQAGKNDVKQYDIHISQTLNPQQYSIGYWVPVNHFVPENTDRLTGSLKMIDWGIAHGFNTFSVEFIAASKDSLNDVEDMKKLFEQAIKLRVNFGLKIGTDAGPSFKGHPEAFGVSKGRRTTETLDNQRGSSVCLREPIVIESALKQVRTEMATFGVYPSLFHALINSEFSSSPCYSEDCIKRLKVETGLNLYDFNINPLRPPKTADEARTAGLPENLINAMPKNGVIENDNPFYRFYLWWFKKGMGEASLNKVIADVVKDYKQDAITWNDPFRLSPTYGGHTGLDCIGQWQYTHPDPKYTAYIETLIAGAKPEHQMVMPDVSTWQYQNWIAPTDSGIIMIPEDIMKENSWIQFSRRPDLISQYNSTGFNPLGKTDAWHRDPKTFDMMKWVAENVYKPLGPVVLQMERTPRKVAILCSGSSILFPEINRGGYVNMAIYPFYSLLMMAHIPTDVIFDETISRYGLDQYDVLILHQCETITRDVYDKVMQFKKRGGFVIGDKLLRADIPLDYKCEFDLDYRKRITPDAILKGNGVTADQDRELMAKYTGEIRKVLDSKVDRFVDSDSPEVLFNDLKSGPVKYIFAINDKRTYGEKFGMKWKSLHEKGVEQTVTIKINAEGMSNPVLYDLREHAVIPAVKTGDIITFTRKLGPCDGTIIAVYPNPIKSVRIECPETVIKDDEAIINISVLDSQGKRNGSQPIYITVTDPSGKVSDYSDYYATTGGIFKLKLIPAVNDLSGNWTVSAKDLTSGLQASSKFNVK